MRLVPWYNVVMATLISIMVIVACLTILGMLAYGVWESTWLGRLIEFAAAFTVWKVAVTFRHHPEWF